MFKACLLENSRLACVLQESQPTTVHSLTVIVQLASMSYETTHNAVTNYVKPFCRVKAFLSSYNFYSL